MKLPKFEGFHISHPSGMDQIPMSIVTCNNCGHAGPVNMRFPERITEIKCRECGQKATRVSKELRRSTK